MNDKVILSALLVIGFSLSLARPFALPRRTPTKTVVITKNGASLTMVTSQGINITIVTKNRVSKGRRSTLYSKNSQKHLRLRANGVDGKGLETDPDAQLVIEGVGFGGQVRIRSLNSARYLCVSGHGTFIIKTKQESKNDNCTFIELYVFGFTAYRTKVNPKWYLGIKNDGRMKSAKKTGTNQRSTHFLER